MNCIRRSSVIMEQAPINVASSIQIAEALLAIVPDAQCQDKAEMAKRAISSALLTRPSKSKSTGKSTRLSTRSFRS